MSVFLAILQGLGSLVCIAIGMIITTTVWERVTRRKRQRRIIKALEQHGILTALQLSQSVGMGSATGFIYQALRDLEREGRVVRIRFGPERRIHWQLPNWAHDGDHPEAIIPGMCGPWKPFMVVVEGDWITGSDRRVHKCVTSGTTGEHEPWWGAVRWQPDGTAWWTTDWSAG